MSNRIFTMVIMCGCMCALAACGGGGGGGAPAPAEADYSGVYQGTATLELRATALWGQKRTLACAGQGPLTVTIAGNEATLAMTKYFTGSFYTSGHAGECIEINEAFYWRGTLSGGTLAVDTGYGTFPMVISEAGVITGSGQMRWTASLEGDPGAKVDVQEYWYLTAGK